jgi:long-chain acyl-CoA synthetase
MNVSHERNLAESVIGAPLFSHASVGELGAIPLSSSSTATSAQQIAIKLGEAGVTPNEPVVLFISNRPEDLCGFLGIWLAGCVAVPIHVGTPEAAMQALILRLGARLAIRASALERVGSAPPPARRLLEGAAIIVFTSGSTGQPKGVVVGHQGLIWKLQVLSRLLAFAVKDTIVVPLQLTFIFGIWVSLLGLMSGSRVILAPKLSTAALNSVGDEITVLAAVPTLLRALCAAEAIRAPNLTRILTGGEPFNPALAETLTRLLPDAKVVDLFGLTESGSCDFCAQSDDQPEARDTIGHPTEGVTFRIAEVSRLGLVPGAGELQIRTPAVMLGYLDDPMQTASAFDGGYLRTGDLAIVREGGYVQLVGRLKDVISRGGNKIAPLEIENLFSRHGAVADVLAFGMPDERLGESLHLMVVARDPSLNESELRAWAKDRLERFKTPDVFHFVDKLPAGRTGKTDRGAARVSLGQQTS